MTAGTQFETLVEKLRQMLDSVDLHENCQRMTVQMERIARLFAPTAAKADVDRSFTAFIRAYITSPPEHLASLAKTAGTLGISEITSPIIDTVTDYLEATSEELRTTTGDAGSAEEQTRVFLQLLQIAYLTHTLCEQLDDAVETFIGVPLSHHDMMQANLIANEILGENFTGQVHRLTAPLIRSSRITRALVEAQLDRARIAELRQHRQALSGKTVTSFAAEFQFELSSGLL